MKYPNVFELVKSLNMSEKRQFKIYGSRHVINGENKYILLFDLLDKMEFYEESLLIAELNKIGRNTTYIKADMNFLYQLILKSLVLFHSGKSAQIIINEYLSVIEILYYKGNYIQSMKEIQKAIIIAEQTELFSSLLKIIQYKKIVQKHLLKTNRTESEINKRMFEINKIQQNIIEYYSIYDNAEQIRKTIVKTRDIKEISTFDNLMQNKIMQSEKLALSIDAKIKYHQIFAMWHYINGNKKLELNCNKKIIQLFENNNLYKEEHLIDYINTHSRIVSISKNMNEILFFQALNNVRNITVQNDKLYYLRVSAQIFNFSYMIELSMYLHKKQFFKADTIVNDIENGLKKYKDILIPSYRITFLYMLTYYYFATGNFDTARKRINTLLNDYSEKERPDLYNFAKLINLLIHFEFKNYSYIKYKQVSVHYYFKKQSAKYEIENLILHFFSKEKNYTSDLSKSLSILATSLQSTKKHSLEKYAFNYFDWMDWINSKVNKKKCISELYK